MKKYLLSALLGVFVLFGAFVSAESLDGFSSSSEVCKYKNNTSFSQVSILDIYSSESSPCHGIVDGENNSLVYVCVSSSDIPYYMQSWGYSSEDFVSVDNSNYCFAGTFDGGSDSDIYFYTDTTSYESKTLNGSIYVSANPITYSPSAGTESDDSFGGLLSGGTNMFSGIISSLSTTINEFIPYLVYVGLGILGAIIGFVAIKRLMNRIRAKIFGTFSGGRRR